MSKDLRREESEGAMEIWSRNISGRGKQGAKVLRQSLLSAFRGKPRVAGAGGAEE